jgi:hypothetical protein
MSKQVPRYWGRNNPHLQAEEYIGFVTSFARHITNWLRVLGHKSQTVWAQIPLQPYGLGQDTLISVPQFSLHKIGVEYPPDIPKYCELNELPHMRLFSWGGGALLGAWAICPGWLWTMILLISASWVARIVGMSHWRPAHLRLFKQCQRVRYLLLLILLLIVKHFCLPC